MWKASDSDCSLSFMGKKLSVLLLWLILGLSLLMLPAFSAQAEVTSYLSGNEANVNPTLAAPVLDLGGGGTDVEKALQWTLDQVRGCTGTNCSKTVDVVVIRFEKDNPRPDDRYDGYNELIYDEMGHIGVDSVETLVFQRRHREDANKPDIVEKIKKAEVLFFAGGDQCKYARNFKNTGVETAVKSVYARGGGIGGTSAGAMIQGNFIFNACTEDKVETPEALEDPYEDIFFTENLFQWNYFQNTLIDTTRTLLKMTEWGGQWRLLLASSETDCRTVRESPSHRDRFRDISRSRPKGNRYSDGKGTCSFHSWRPLT